MVRLTANHNGRAYYDSTEERLLPGEDWQMLRDRLERNWRRGARARIGGEMLPTPRAMLDEHAHALVAVAANERHLRSILSGTRLDDLAGTRLDDLVANLGLRR